MMNILQLCTIYFTVFYNDILLQIKDIIQLNNMKIL